MAQEPSLAEAWDRTEPSLGDAWDRTDPTLGDYARELPQALLSGAMRFGGEAARGFGRAADVIREMAPALDIGITFGDGPNQSAFTAAGEALSGAAPEVDPIVAQSVPGRIASGIGQVAAMGATALASPAAALGGAVLGGVSDMDRQLAGADLDAGERALYMLAGGGVSALEMVPIGGLLARLNKVSGGTTTSALRRIIEAGALRSSVGNVAATAGLEGATEQAQAELVNALVAHATDEDYQILQDWREGVAGTGVGGILATAVEVATGKRRRLAAAAARHAMPIAEARERYLSPDAEFRAAVDFERDADIAEDLGTRLNLPVEPVAEGHLDPERHTVTYDPVSGVQELPGEAPEKGDGRRVRTQSIEGEYEPVPHRYDDGTPYPAGITPNQAEGQPGRTGRGRDPMRLQQEYDPTVPRQFDGTPYPPGLAPGSPGEGARAAGAVVGPSSAAYTPIPSQSGPQGQPVFAISGTSGIDAWGGTRENTIGAKQAVRLEDISSSLVQAAEELGVRVERMTNDLGSPVLGLYRHGGVIQVTPESVTEFAHEVGHAVHRVLMQNQRSGAAASQDWDSALTGLAPVVQGELRKLGAAQATGQPGRELTEGLAELTRLWVSAPEALSQAPQAKQWFEGWLLGQPPKVQQALVEAQARAQTYRFQGDELRTRVAPPSTLFSRTRARLSMVLPDAARTLFDDAYAVDAFDARMDAMGKSGNLSQREMVRANRGLARGLTANWLHGTPSDFYGREVQTPNFDAIVKRLGKGEQRAFGDYLHARATLAREATGYDTGLAPAEARRKLDLYDREKPHFAAVSDALQQWLGGVNGVLAQYSPTYAAELARIQAADAEQGIDFYVPLKRAFAEGKGKGSNRALIESGAVSKRRTEGSSRAVLNPLEMLANEGRVRFERAVYRNALESMVALHDAALEGGATDSGASPWIREVKAGDIPSTTYDPDSPDGFEALADVLSGPKLTGDRIFVQVRDAQGRRRVFSMDPKIAQLAVNVDPLTLRQGLGFFGKTLSLARRGFVASTITYNPVFQFWTNLLYDLPSAYMASEYVRTRDLPMLVGQVAKNVAQGLLHQGSSGRVDARWERLYDSLGLHGAASTQSELAVGRAVRGVAKRTTKIANGWDALGVFMSVPQRATQIALMQRAAKARGIDINNLDAEGAMVLRLAARQPVDYTAGSQLSRRWQATVPFLRAALDGPKQLAESAKRNPVEFLAKIGTLSALAAATKWLYGDDELERSKTAEERLSTISVPLGDGPDAEVLQLKLPNELRVLVMGPAMLVDALRGQEGPDAADLGIAALLSLAPPTILDNPLIQTAMQQVSGKQRPLRDLFSDDRPLVPAEFHGQNPLSQQGTQTAPVAVQAATAMDAALAGMGFSPTSALRQGFGSPVRVEAMIRSTVGGNALAAVESYGLVEGLKPQREYEPGEQLAGALRRGGMTSWDDPAIRAVYDMDAEAAQAHKSRDGTQPEDVATLLRRQSIRQTAVALSLMRFLSTHEAEGMTVAGRRDLARRAQTMARTAVSDLAKGGYTSAYLSAADIRQRRALHDLNRGAFWK